MLVIALIDKTKDSACVYLGLMMKSQIFGEEMSQEQRHAKASLLFQALVQEHLKLSHRIHLGACLSNLLSTKGGKINCKNGILTFYS